jgi:SAM-dependent methyltransferase
MPILLVAFAIGVMLCRGSKQLNLKYISIGIIRRLMPEQVLFAVMKWRGNGNIAENAPDTYFATWREQLADRGLSLAGKHVLELGSGRYARLALRMLAAGARRVTLVDYYAIPFDDPHHYAMLVTDCTALGLDAGDALARIEIFRDDFLALPLPTPDRTVDLVTSSAVLEHVQDPGAILARSYQWLKPGGLAYHVIDLRDHNLSFKYPFEMLTFSETVWNRWIDLRGGFHLNRWRAPNYLLAMSNAGFVNVQYEALQQDLEGLRMIMPRLNSRFRTIHGDMLAILGLSVFGQKMCE